MNEMDDLIDNRGLTYPVLVTGKNWLNYIVASRLRGAMVQQLTQIGF